MKKWIFTLVMMISSTILSATAKPIFLLTTDTKTLSLSTGSIGEVTYQLTNNTTAFQNQLVYDPGYPSNKCVSINTASSTCGTSLAAGASCSLVLNISGGSNATSFKLTPRVCAQKGLACSIPTSAYQTLITVTETEPTTLTLTVDAMASDRHLQYRALSVNNSGASAVTLSSISALIPANLENKVILCDAASNCTPPSGSESNCSNGTTLNPLSSCLIWFKSIDDTNEALTSINGAVTLNIATNPSASFNTNSFSITYSNKLYAGGSFTTAGGVSANRIAEWNGVVWTALGDGTNNQVNALTIFDGDLIVGGNFSNAGSVVAARIARWDGLYWNTLSTGMNNTGVNALTVFDNQLIAGGDFTTAGGVATNRIAAWDGATWSPLSTGMNSTVNALTAYGSSLAAGGTFTTAGGVAANRIALWDGANWSALSTGTNNSVNTLIVFNDTLAVGGTFTLAGGVVNTSRIAIWNGSAWSALSTGADSDVNTLSVLGSNLIAGGSFSTIGGVAAARVAQWNGSLWSTLSTGLNNTANASVAFSTNVMVGGSFTTAGGSTANRIAQWNGTTWSALTTGLNNTALTVLVASSLDIN